MIVLPMQLIAGLIALYYMMGLAVLPAFGVLLLSVIINIFVSRKYKDFKKSFMAKKDARAKVMVELFENIKFVKLSGFEKRYIVERLRKKEEEIEVLQRLFYRYIFSSVFNELVPAIFVFSINAFYLWHSGTFNLQKVFTSMIILNIFKKNLRLMPELMLFLVDSAVSARRISFYLCSEEIDDSYITYIDPKPKPGSDAGPRVAITRDAIDLKDGQFYWKDEDAYKDAKVYKDEVFTATTSDGKAGSKNNDILALVESSSLLEYLIEDEPNQEQKFDLRNINLTITRGAKVAVIVKIGSGKTSFLSALLSELYNSPQTKLIRDLRVAYAAQET